MLDLLYLSLFLLALLLCCNAAVGACVLLHSLRRMRSEEQREVREDADNLTLMGSVRETWR